MSINVRQGFPGRFLFWIAFGFVGLFLLVVLIPDSPLSLARVWVRAPTIEGKTAAQWVQLLKKGDLETSYHALESLSYLSTQANDSQGRIGEFLAEDNDESLRVLASLVLSKMQPPPVDAIPQLKLALNDDDPRVRANVARALFRIGPPAKTIIPEIIEGVKNKGNQNYAEFTKTIQEVLILALGRACSDASPEGSAMGLETLKEVLLHGETQQIKNAAIRALGMVGPGAQSLVPLIKKTAGKEFWPFQEDAQTALEAIGLSANDLAIRQQPSEDLILPESDRKYIWDMEHHGNVLGKNGFSPFCNALAEENETALKGFFAKDFRGRISFDKKSLKEERDRFWVERKSPSGTDSRESDISSFVSELISWRKPFGKSKPQAKIALIGISPLERGKLDGPWEVKGQLRMHGTNEGGGPVETVATIRFVLERPTRERLSQGAWIREADIHEVATGMAKHQLFADVTRDRGLKTSHLFDHWDGSRFMGTTGGIYVTDFNKDGWLDLLVTDVNGGTLYEGGPGGVFTDVSEKVGLSPYLKGAMSAAWVDVDQDGWEDLILGQRVFKNEGGVGFSDKTPLVRTRLPEDYINILIADFDRDGKPDLYFSRTGKPGVNSWLEGKSEDHRTNLLYRNLGNWKWENVTEKAGVAGNHFSTFSAAWLDANNDGWPDLHAPNEFGDGLLFINQKDGTFKPTQLSPNPADFGTMGLAAGDINNDGNIDLYCANMYSKAGTRVIGNLPKGAFPEPILTKMRQFVAGSQLHLNQGNGRFVQAGKSMHVAGVGWAYGPVLADLDNDGWLDIYATAGFCSRDRNEPDG